MSASPSQKKQCLAEWMIHPDNKLRLVRPLEPEVTKRWEAKVAEDLARKQKKDEETEKVKAEKAEKKRKAREEAKAGGTQSTIDGHQPAPKDLQLSKRVNKSVKPVKPATANSIRAQA